MLYIRFPLSLRNVEDLLHERGIEVSHETVRYWWNRFGPMFAAEIRRRRVGACRATWKTDPSSEGGHMDEPVLQGSSRGQVSRRIEMRTPDEVSAMLALKARGCPIPAFAAERRGPAA